MTDAGQTSQKDLLSQEEIDALFQGLGGKPVQGGEHAAFDWQSLPRMTRGAMPALEVVNQRLLRKLQGALPPLLGRQLDISVHDTVIKRYSDFLDETPVPSGCAVVNLRPYAGQGLLVVDLALADVLVDLLHGGTGKAQNAPDARSFATMGQRALQRLLGVVTSACSQAWHGVADMGFEFDRLEIQARHAHIATALDRVALSVFKLQIGEVLGTLSICLPLPSLAPIRDATLSPTWGDFVHSDPRWRGMLAREIPSLVVPLAAYCQPIETSLARVMALRAGDFIELGGEPQWLATPEGLTLFEGRLQSQSGHQAILIERVATTDADGGTA